MEHGQQIAYFGEGEPMVDGEPGDLQVVLRFVLFLMNFLTIYLDFNHMLFSNAADPISTQTWLFLSRMPWLVSPPRYHLQTFTKIETLQVTHLDGHEVKIERSAVTWHGFKMRVKNEGMPLPQDNTKV